MSNKKKSDHDYEPGDKVRCLSPEWPGRYSHYLEVGEIYTVEMVTDEGNIFVEEEIGRYYPRQFGLCGCSEKENTMSDEKKPDHNYDPEKIRGVIQDHLYCEPESLGDVEPPENAEEIEDGIRVGELSLPSCCRIFFRVMGSWFSLDVGRERIENDPTVAERFVDDDLSDYDGQIRIDQRLEYTKLRFEDGSEAKMFGSYREVL